MLSISAATALMIATILAVGIPFLIWKVLRIENWVPLTVTQITAGLLLGPSILGALVPADAYNSVFGPAQINAIQPVATLAVVLFGFLAGVGADRDVIRKSAGMTAATGLASFLGPLLLGILPAYWIALQFPSAMGATGSPFVFGLAFGLVMSITALPVLAAILVESGIMKARVSSVALAGSGVGNAFVWVGFALILALASANMPMADAAAAAKGGGVSVWWALGKALIGLAVLVGFCLLIAVPVLNRLPEGPKADNVVLAVVVVMVAFCAVVADRQVSGLDTIIGAFVAGLFLPEKLRKPLTEMLERPVLVILVPFFFLLAGLKTVFAGGDASLYYVLVAGLVIGVLGKIFSTSIAARACGESWAFGNILGVFAQTKGLIAVVLTVQLYQDGKGVFGAGSYTALVIVSMVCTALTIPLMRLIMATSKEARAVVYEGTADPAVAAAAPVTPTEPYAAESTTPLIKTPG